MQLVRDVYQFLLDHNTRFGIIEFIQKIEKNYEVVTGRSKYIKNGRFNLP